MITSIVVAVPGLASYYGVMVKVDPEVATERSIFTWFTPGTSVTPAGSGDES